ncbi:MAG: fibronectin type III domain-containing protein [Gammaproteobacteria bacterium]|nr:fibronectin type III domain-containing protein [Gammaproteobacteria bacterium]
MSKYVIKSILLVSLLITGLSACEGTSSISNETANNNTDNRSNILSINNDQNTGANNDNNAYVILNWMPPELNTDGSSLDNLNGYKIYYGPAPDLMVYSINIDDANAFNYVIENLFYNTVYFFTITSINSQGIESNTSNIVSKHISFGS